jgi:hypothetical protein
LKFKTWIPDQNRFGNDNLKGSLARSLRSLETQWAQSKDQNVWLYKKIPGFFCVPCASAVNALSLTYQITSAANKAFDLKPTKQF